MTIYLTFDAEGCHIAKCAEISSHRDMDAALAAARNVYAYSDFEVAGLEPGSFGDCWIKLYSDPRTDDGKIAPHIDTRPFTAQEMMVLAPGQHPGGRAWWIEPGVTVYVPILREKGAA